MASKALFKYLPGHQAGASASVSVLVNGSLICTETPDEVRADPEVRRAYLGDSA